MDEVRPARCSGCEAASRPAGMGLVLHGHGLRSRQQRGPLEVGGVPRTVVLQARRYRCTQCPAVLLVVARGVLRFKHFSGSAVALAIVLWGAMSLSAREVREQVNPWRIVGHTACMTWASLHRWVREVRAGRLFSGVGAFPAQWELRDVAREAALSIAAAAPPSWASRPLEQRTFAGGAHMA